MGNKCRSSVSRGRAANIGMQRRVIRLSIWRKREEKCRKRRKSKHRWVSEESEDRVDEVEEEERKKKQGNVEKVNRYVLTNRFIEREVRTICNYVQYAPQNYGLDVTKRTPYILKDKT